jgi:transposase InsO family protein
MPFLCKFFRVRGPPEHEPEGELLGQCLRRIIFQNSEAGVGNPGRQTFRGGGEAISVMYLEAYYNRLRLHSALDYVAPAMFNSGRVA